jgi:CheY-like chemotaxis protein
MVVDVVHRGDEALETGCGGGYDAVGVDVMMPGLDGFEVRRGLREAAVRSPILLLTARADVEDRVRARRRGRRLHAQAVLDGRARGAHPRPHPTRSARRWTQAPSGRSEARSGSAQGVPRRDGAAAVRARADAARDVPAPPRTDPRPRPAVAPGLARPRPRSAPISSTCTCATCAKRWTGRSAWPRSRPFGGSATACAPTAAAAYEPYSVALAAGRRVHGRHHDRPPSPGPVPARPAAGHRGWAARRPRLRADLHRRRDARSRSRRAAGNAKVGLVSSCRRSRSGPFLPALSAGASTTWPPAESRCPTTGGVRWPSGKAGWGSGAASRWAPSADSSCYATRRADSARFGDAAAPGLLVAQAIGRVGNCAARLSMSVHARGSDSAVSPR